MESVSLLCGFSGIECSLLVPVLIPRDLEGPVSYSELFWTSLVSSTSISGSFNLPELFVPTSVYKKSFMSIFGYVYVSLVDL